MLILMTTTILIAHVLALPAYLTCHANRDDPAVAEGTT
jgi:hypothetical protein